MKILMTGASGFIGSYVLKELLSRGHNVIALSSSEIKEVKTIAINNYSFSNNYLSENGCDDVELLLLLGAFTPKTKNDANNLEECQKNIDSTNKLLSSNLPNLKKIIYISTLDVYEFTNNIIDEKTPINPATLYGASKFYCEKMVQCYCKVNNITPIILRIGHIYGIGEDKYKKVLPVIIDNAINNQPITIFGTGNALRSFLHVEDVAKAISNAINLESEEIINLVSNNAISLNDLAKTIIKISNKAIEIKHIESTFPDVNYVFNNTKMKNLLLDKFINFYDGLKEEYDYYERKKNLI